MRNIFGKGAPCEPVQEKGFNERRHHSGDIRYSFKIQELGAGTLNGTSAVHAK